MEAILKVSLLCQLHPPALLTIQNGNEADLCDQLFVYIGNLNISGPPSSPL